MKKMESKEVPGCININNCDITQLSGKLLKMVEIRAFPQYDFSFSVWLYLCYVFVYNMQRWYFAFTISEVFYFAY